MKDNRINTLATNIRVERARKNITLTSLAKTIGKTNASLSLIENGKQVPAFFYVLDIANALEINICRLFEGMPKEAQTNEG